MTQNFKARLGRLQYTIGKVLSACGLGIDNNLFQAFPFTEQCINYPLRYDQYHTG